MFSAPSVFAVLASLLVLHPKSGSGSGSPSLLNSPCGQMRTGHSKETLGPWTALLHEDGRIACAGTLIDSRFILTAAHCIRAGETLKVRLGVYGTVGAEQPEDHFVDKAFRHRHYNNVTFVNDIGLMRLSRPVEYKYHIQPICIFVNPSQGHISYIDKTTEFIGSAWDRSCTENCQDSDFYAINIKRTQCPNGSTAQGKLQICGWNQRTGASCDGPSGSALTSYFTQSVQIGIASYTDVDCKPQRLYTDVVRYSEWIQQIIHFHGGSWKQIINQPIVFPTF